MPIFYTLFEDNRCMIYQYNFFFFYQFFLYDAGWTYFLLLSHYFVVQRIESSTTTTTTKTIKTVWTNEIVSCPSLCVMFLYFSLCFGFIKQYKWRKRQLSLIQSTLFHVFHASCDCRSKLTRFFIKTSQIYTKC